MCFQFSPTLAGARTESAPVHFLSRSVTKLRGRLGDVNALRVFVAPVPMAGRGRRLPAAIDCSNPSWARP